jgi:hypothetical protein
MTPPLDYRDYDRTEVGVDDTNGYYPEISIQRCIHCSRVWLHYYIESEGYPRSGRWYRGVITPLQAESVTVAGALAILAGLSWHLYGGGHYGTTGARRDLPLDPKYVLRTS